jgi:hypothetical protein
LSTRPAPWTSGTCESHVGQRSGGVSKTVPQKQATVQLMARLQLIGAAVRGTTCDRAFLLNALHRRQIRPNAVGRHATVRAYYGVSGVRRPRQRAAPTAMMARRDPRADSSGDQYCAVGCRSYCEIRHVDGRFRGITGYSTRTSSRSAQCGRRKDLEVVAVIDRRCPADSQSASREPLIG